MIEIVCNNCRKVGESPYEGWLTVVIGKPSLFPHDPIDRSGRRDNAGDFCGKQCLFEWLDDYEIEDYGMP